MSTKVNNNIKVRLNSQEKKEAYNEIKKACTRHFSSPDNRKGDLKRMREIFNKYFDKENPLLDINEPISVDGGSGGFTPLMTTTWLGYQEETTELLKLGADPQVAPDKNAFPLHIAAANNRVLIVHTLLNNKNSIINLKNTKGQTPLICAAEAGNLEVVKDLITIFNADVTIMDNDKRTAIEHAKDAKKFTVETYLRYFSMEEKLDHKKEDKRVNKI
jgi:ankyrin repeat protein